MYVPYIRKFYKNNNNFKEAFMDHIIKLHDCFCELLKKVDIAFFSHKLKKGPNAMFRDKTAKYKEKN